MINQSLILKLYNASLGKAATESIVAENGIINLKKYNKFRMRRRRLHREFNQRPRQLEFLQTACTQHIRPVKSPLVLISQIQRSGGSLLSQLFDGHPEIDAHPHELKFGFPRKYTWPQIDLNEAPIRWLEVMFEDSVVEHFKAGYKKQANMDETFAFIFLPFIQKALFCEYISSIAPVSVRDVFDAYMTSYFGAWLNNQNVYGEKKFVTGFTARLALYEDNMKSFFAIYPDGRLITIIRNPKNWYPSAARHRPTVYGNLRESLEFWKMSAASMLRNKAMFGDRVCILTFEDLIGRTEMVMRYLAELLHIAYDDILLTPTFNKFPIKANTSFKTQQHGIITKTLDRYKTLDAEDVKTIEEMTSELHQQVLNEAVKF